MVICLFGTYESKFPRTLTIKMASEKNGYTLLECHYPFWELTREKHVFFSVKSMIRSALKILCIYFKLIWKYLQIMDHDVMIVGYNGYFDMPLAKLLAKIRKKPLIFTPVFPLYTTLVDDRKYLDKTSLKSTIVHKIDEIGCKLADLVIIETEEFLNYYHEEFGVPRRKLFKIPLGADETSFFIRKKPKHDSGQVKVLFYGKFIPLQGIHYIIEAAKLLEDNSRIEFEVIGSGQLSQEIDELSKRLDIKNITFIDWVEYGELPKHIQCADICLGIFGDTLKSRRGIPIKVYEALAMQKPVITGASPAAKEVFTDKVNAVLCEMANARALSESILLLSRDMKLREKIAKEGHKVYKDIFSSEYIARKFEKAVNKCVTHFRRM